jgi:hypothetical protein
MRVEAGRDGATTAHRIVRRWESIVALVAGRTATRKRQRPGPWTEPSWSAAPLIRCRCAANLERVMGIEPFPTNSFPLNHLAGERSKKTVPKTIPWEKPTVAR